MARAFITRTVAVVLVSLAPFVATGSPQSTITDSQLLAGDVLPWDASSPSTLVDEEEAFGLDDEMRAFVAPLSAVADPAARVRALGEAMERERLFSLAYTNAFTRTAREAFHERQANCLSYTMLFVALARAAGLDATYNVVDVPPTFDGELGRIVVGRHVNATVTISESYRYVVDFNEPNFREKYPRRAVSERYAVALFYNNLGGEALVREEYERGFALLREAARVNSDVAGPWVNLGVLYARHGFYAHAVAANLRALSVDPMEMSALANLASVYTTLGERRLAADYRRRIRNYRKINPYYHFALAQIAYGQERFKDARDALRQAIRLKPDDEQFYLLQGHTFAQLGRTDHATESFNHARTVAAAER